MALRAAARLLREATTPPERNRALNINHQIWSALFRELNGTACALPPILRKDCIQLAAWSLDYSTRAVLTNLPLSPLADLNGTVAEGLEGEPARIALPPSPTTAPASAAWA